MNNIHPTYTEPATIRWRCRPIIPMVTPARRKTAYITVNPPVPDVTIAPAGDDAVLEWPPVTEDVNGNLITAFGHYEAWRSLEPALRPR